jgi:serine/threonine protein kinase
MVFGRPTYRKQGQDVFLFYSAEGKWTVGPNKSKPAGWWMVESTATMPSGVRGRWAGEQAEVWTVQDDGGWVEVGAAKIVNTAEAAASAKSEAAGREAELARARQLAMSEEQRKAEEAAANALTAKLIKGEKCSLREVEGAIRAVGVAEEAVLTHIAIERQKQQELRASMERREAQHAVEEQAARESEAAARVEAEAAHAAQRKAEAAAKAKAEVERRAKQELVAELVGETFSAAEACAAIEAVGPDKAAARNHIAIARQEEQERLEAEAVAAAKAEAERQRQREAVEAAEAAERVLQQRRRAAERVPPAELVGKRVEIDGAGAGEVLGPFKKGTLFCLGPSSHKVALDDDGSTRTLLLRRHGNGGTTFVLLDDGAAVAPVPPVPARGGGAADVAPAVTAADEIEAALVRTRMLLAKGGLTCTEISFADLSNQVHIAKGGFGDVSRVVYRDTIMARKKINTITQVDEDRAVRFLRNEAMAMSAVLHPNIVLLIGICIQPGELSLLMEYAELGTLRDQLEKDPRMPAWRRFQLLLGVVNGVRRLHAHTPEPIIHADLKSANVLITIDAATGGWVAKLTDFGLATGSGLTTTGGTKASGLTVSHSSPEVLGGGKTAKTTTSTDTYSLAIVAWEVATGQIPFDGMTPMEVMSGVCMRSMRPALPATPPLGSVFNAAQWALFTEQLLPGSDSDPGGCWAQDAAVRPTAADIVRSFQGAAQHFEAPAGAGHTLQLQHLNHKMGDLQLQQEVMQSDIRELQQLAMRMNGALNAIVAGDGIECFRLFWIVPAPPSGDGLVSRIKDRAAALSPAKWLSKDVLLVPLDEFDLKPIPCGPDPTDNPGFPLTLPKQFYKDHAAAIKLSYKLLKYALKAGKLANLPLPQLPDGPVGAMGELLDSVCDTAAKQLPSAVNTALDAAADSLETSTAAAGGTDAGKAKATKATGKAYLKLKALVDKKHPTWRQSMSGGPRTSADGRVGWVRAENVADWEASRS